MKAQLTLAILILIIFGCSNKQKVENSKSDEKESIITEEKVFKQVNDFPKIKDTLQFITDLRQTLEFEVDESPFQKEKEKITVFKKIKLNGSDKDYFFIEYDYGAGSGASYPWKYQLILTKDGKHIKTLSAQRFEFVEIFKNENPFLMTVIATDKGNWGHEFYKISADTLQNVYEGYFNYSVRTYDAHQDNKIYEPNELKLNVKDFNKDGLNDISFNGKIVLIQGTKYGHWFDSETINGKTITYSVENPFKKIPIEFIFLYDKQTRKFKAKENYNDKYKLYE